MQCLNCGKETNDPFFICSHKCKEEFDEKRKDLLILAEKVASKLESGELPPDYEKIINDAFWK
jgi:hypothetical protein